MAPPEEIDEAVRRLIAGHIHSVEQLEVLLLLHREPSREWTAAEVSQQVATHPLSAETRLLDLRSRGFLAATEGEGELHYRYAPEPSLAEPVSRLAAVYAERRTSVITLIFSKPIDSVRTLADAFVVRPQRRGDKPEKP